MPQDESPYGIDTGVLKMLIDYENNVTDGTHIRFWKEPKDPKRKTDTYFVGTKDHNNVLNDNLLGDIRWFSRWRKYSFNPYNNTTYEETCLREIAEFCERETKKYKGKK